MKRFNVSLPEGKLKLYFPNIKIAKSHYPNALYITKNKDMSYVAYIEKIKQLAVDSVQKKGKEMYKLDLPVGVALVVLSKDMEDGVYYDFCKYQILKKTALVYPVGFTLSTPKEFCEKYLTKPLEYQLVSYRVYGQPKLSKPKELRGIKQSGSVSFIGRAKCQYYIVGDDVYIKHRDYFSETYCKPEDVGTPLIYRVRKYGIKCKVPEKFQYADNWGAIVLRNEAWVKLSNLIPLVKQTSHPELLGREIADLQGKYHKFIHRLDGEWYRFWEDLCKQLGEGIK